MKYWFIVLVFIATYTTSSYAQISDLCNVQLGEKGELFDNQNNYVLSYATEAICKADAIRGMNNVMSHFDEKAVKFTKAGIQQEHIAETRLVNEHKAARLPNHTKVIVFAKGARLDFGGGMMELGREVKITSGTRAGQIWWVSGGGVQPLKN